MYIVIPYDPDIPVVPKLYIKMRKTVANESVIAETGTRNRKLVPYGVLSVPPHNNR